MTAVFGTSTLAVNEIGKGYVINSFASDNESVLSNLNAEFVKPIYIFMTDRVVSITENGHRKITLAGLSSGLTKAQCQLIINYYNANEAAYQNNLIKYEKNHRLPPIRADPE